MRRMGREYEMTLSLNIPESQSREQRLGSITGYHGTFKKLTQQGCAGCLGNRKRCFSTVSSCSHTHAVNQLAGIKDAVVVDHAPVGCSAGMINFSINRNRVNFNDSGEKRHLIVVSSNMKESDTIFGGTEKLKKTIRAAYRRHKPKAIYVSTSCTSSIIGDDVNSVVQEMSEELNIPVGYAAGEGIKSKIWASGFDAYCHAVANTIIKPPKEKKNTINYIAFTQINRERMDAYIEKLGLKVIYITGKSSIEDYEKASQSIASFGQCGAQSSYLAGALEQMFGIKYFQSHLPFGGIGFERFYRDIAKFLGKEEIAEQVINEDREKYKEELDYIRGKLAGKTAFVALGASYAFEYTRILRELGVKVLRTVAYHYDPKLDNQSDDLVAAATDAEEFDYNMEVSVNDAQQFETYLLVKNNKPDFIISRAHGASVWGVKMGIPAIEAKISLEVFGYAGLVSFGKIIVNELSNNNFVKKLGRRYESPFTDKFEQSEPYSYLEEAK